MTYEPPFNATPDPSPWLRCLGPRPWEAAYRASAEAVAAVMQGGRVERVKLATDPDDPLPCSIRLTLSRADWIEASVVDLARYVTECRVSEEFQLEREIDEDCGEADWDLDSFFEAKWYLGDSALAGVRHQIAEGISAPPGEADREINCAFDFLVARTDRLVGTWWAHIVRVAENLLLRGALTGDEVDALLRED